VHFNFFCQILSLNIISVCSHGKTTLLRHIASRAFAIPPNIDILYCEQEVVAEELSAVEVVIKADVKRTELLEELKKLEESPEADTIAGQEKIKEVRKTFIFRHVCGRKRDSEFRSFRFTTSFARLELIQRRPVLAVFWRVWASLGPCKIDQPTAFRVVGE